MIVKNAKYFPFITQHFRIPRKDHDLDYDINAENMINNVNVYVNTNVAPLSWKFHSISN